MRADDRAAPAVDERAEDGDGDEGDEEGEDLLEETPDFLQDAPEGEDLWFEQGPPKDFDFDDDGLGGVSDVAAGAGGLDDPLDPGLEGGRRAATASPARRGRRPRGRRGA